MSVYLGNTKIGQMYLGSTEIGQAYLGNAKVWEKGGSLPYDAQIEYLQSSGTQWIDTGIIQNSRNIEIRMRIQWVGANTSNFESFFAYMINGGLMPRCSINKYQGNWMFGTNATTKTTTAIDKNVHDVFWTSNATTQIEQLYLDNVKIGEGSTTSTGIGRNTIPFFLFCRNRNGSVDNIATARIMSLSYKKFSDATHTEITEEVNFIPVRVGQVGYIYDKVSGQLFGNAGTGSFILGNDI